MHYKYFRSAPPSFFLIVQQSTALEINRVYAIPMTGHMTELFEPIDYHSLLLHLGFHVLLQCLKFAPPLQPTALTHSLYL